MLKQFALANSEGKKKLKFLGKNSGVGKPKNKDLRKKYARFTGKN